MKKYKLKYRVKLSTRKGKPHYALQERFLFIWITIHYYKDEEMANTICEKLNRNPYVIIK